MIGVLHGGQIKIGPLYLLGRDSAGDFGIAFWHARRSPCWLWAVNVQRYREGETRRLLGWTAQHGAQWHRWLHVLRLFKIGFAGQPHSWTRPYRPDDPNVAEDRS